MFIRKVLIWLVVLFGLLGHLPSKAQMLYGNRFNQLNIVNNGIQFVNDSLIYDTAVYLNNYISYFTNVNFAHFNWCDNKGKSELYFRGNTIWDQYGLVDSFWVQNFDELNPLNRKGSWVFTFGSKKLILARDLDSFKITIPRLGIGYNFAAGFYAMVLNRNNTGKHTVDSTFKIHTNKLIVRETAVVQHANGRDFWLYYLDPLTSRFKSILIDETFTFPETIASDILKDPDNYSYRKSFDPLSISYDGTKALYYNTRTDSMYFYAVDRCKGKLDLVFTTRNPFYDVKFYLGDIPVWGSDGDTKAIPMSIIFAENSNYLSILGWNQYIAAFKVNYINKTIAVSSYLDTTEFLKMAVIRQGSFPQYRCRFIPNSAVLMPDRKIYFFPAIYCRATVDSPYLDEYIPYLEPYQDSMIMRYPGIRLRGNYTRGIWGNGLDHYVGGSINLYNPVLGPVAGSVCDSLSNREPEVVDLDPKMPTREYTPPAPLPPKAKPLQLYPNPPVNGWVYLQGLPEGSKPLLHLTDMLGRTVATLQATNYSNGNYSFNTQNLPAGVYTASLVYPPTNLLPTKLVVVVE